MFKFNRLTLAALIGFYLNPSPTFAFNVQYSTPNAVTAPVVPTDIFHTTDLTADADGTYFDATGEEFLNRPSADPNQQTSPTTAYCHYSHAADEVTTIPYTITNSSGGGQRTANMKWSGGTILGETHHEFDNFFYGLDDPITITAATRANPGVFTYSGAGDAGADPLANTDSIYFQTVGMTELNDTKWFVRNIDTTANTFQINVAASGGTNVDTSGYAAAFVSGTTKELVGYCNSAVFELSSDEPLTTGSYIHDVRADQIWDFVHYNSSPCFEDFSVCTNQISHVWISGGIDDCIENDGLSKLVITDSLLDDCFVGISMDNGNHGVGTPCATPNTVPKNLSTGNDCFPRDSWLLMDGVLLNLVSRVQTANGVPPPHDDGLGPFKFNGTRSPKIIINNSIIAFNIYDSGAHSRWTTGWDRIKELQCSNNYLLWLDDSALPDIEVDKVPDCFTIVTDEGVGSPASDIWNAAKTAWIARHPHLDTIP